MTPVEQIKERLSILDVVSAYVELTKAGRHYKGRSPFTNEKTPSFFVSPDRGMYYCFSSQKGGDIFTFVEEMEGVDFKGALKILAEKANVELTQEDPKKRSEREAQYALLDAAAQFFFKQREAHPDVTEYAQKRGVKGKTFHEWRIGYAPPEWRALKAHLQAQNFTEAQIQKAGLIKNTEGSKESYDVFRDRLMFPICDSSGRVVAFSGRAMHADEKTPKYVNSPETELYEKSKILFGYDKAKHGIRQFDFTLIVEGQFDVVLAHQAGYTNTVAVSGTALTDDQIALLERLSTRVVLALDADRAGISAIKRSSPMMLKRGMDVKVAPLPLEKDPADIIVEDPKTFKKIIGASDHVIDFLLRALRSVTADPRAYKLRAREEIVPLLLAMSNRIDRDHFEGVIADAIGTKKDVIHYEVERLANAATEDPYTEARSEPAAKEQPRIGRKDDLIKSLYALTLVLDREHQALADRITAHLSELLDQDMFAALKELPKEEISRITFLAEQYLADMRTQMLYNEVSSMLTELSHMIARTWLADVRARIAEAERQEDHDAFERYLGETKRAEALLQNTIDIPEPDV